MSVSLSGLDAAAQPAAPLRAVLVRAERVTPDFLASWNRNGATAVVVPLDEATRPRWPALARTVAQAGLDLFAWVEVARNPAMADAHPDWMASPGGHHDDWRRRFPKAPLARRGEVVKVWPWVPIGYAPAFEAHRRRLESLLTDLPGAWAGVFLNDLQGGPSSCGCGNDQCRWALDYGSPSTAPKVPGDDAAARLVAGLQQRHPGKRVIPVWVTECQASDLPGTEGGTGLCGGVPCAKGDCWPRYARTWDPLVRATSGPIALAAWPEPFRRDPERWNDEALDLFLQPRGGLPLPPGRCLAVLQGWRPDADHEALSARAARAQAGWVLALDLIEQSWEPRVVKVSGVP